MENNLGPLIRSRLKEMKKSHGWLAEKASVSNAAVSKWIATGKISYDKLSLVAKILSISLDDLTNSSGHLSAVTRRPLALVYVDEVELQLITAHRESNPMGKSLIETAARSAPRAESVDLAHSNNKS